jgi:hypothetical protein
MGEMGNVYRILVGKPKGMIPLEDLGGRMILKWILRKWGWRV